MLTRADLFALMAAAEWRPGMTRAEVVERAKAEGALTSWRAWLPVWLEHGRQVAEDLRAVRAHHHFIATNIGQPGCIVRLSAERYVAALDAAIAALSPITPASQAEVRAPAAIRSNPAGAHSSVELTQAEAEARGLI